MDHKIPADYFDYGSISYVDATIVQTIDLIVLGKG